MFNRYRFVYLTIGVMLLSSIFGAKGVMAAMSEKHCVALAETDYENIYCQVKFKVLGNRLPDFYEFRESQEWIQASLLKKPAQEAYITLPKPKKHKKRVDAYWWKNETQQPVTTQAMVKEHRPKTLEIKPAVVTKPRDPCRYSVAQITCAQSHWQLQKNKSNRHLPADALSDDNAMKLPKQNGESDNQYLTQAYPVYIKKMLDIGLGGSTMAYTRFARVYEEGKKQGLVFNERFEKMYTLLKKERQVMGVSNKLPKDFIPSETSCFVWQPTLMTCDNNQHNLVYTNH